MTIKPLTGMTPATALTGSELFYAQQTGVDVKVIANQFCAQHYLATNYGVKANGSTDDTTALQAAFNAVIATGGTLELPSGVMPVSSTIVLAPGSTGAINVLGQGFGVGSFVGSEFLWTGASTSTPMFQINNLQRSVFRGFLIRSNSPNPLAVGIQSEANSTGSTGANTYQDITINGTVEAGLGKGFAFTIGSGGIDAGNDTSVFIHCTVSNYATAGWSFEHSQSKGHNFYGCQFQGGAVSSLYGLSTALGNPGGSDPGEGGSFSWYGGGGHSNTGADFYIGQPNDAVGIYGANCETSKRFIIQPTSAFTTSPFPINVVGCRFSGDALHSDGQAVIIYSGGPINFVGNSIGGAATTKALTIWLQGSPTYGTSMGNYYGSTSANVLTGAAGSPYHWISNMDVQNNNGSLGLVVPEQIVNQQAYQTNSSTSASTLLAGANISGGTIEQTLGLTGAITAASNAQLPTVANLLTSVDAHNVVVQTNQTYKLRIINIGGSSSGVWTVTTNTGWTLNGTMTIAVGAWRDFYVTITDPVSAITATLQSVGTGTS